MFKAQLPVETEGEEPKFIAIKKIKKQVGDGHGQNNLSDEESRQLDKWSRQIQSEIRTVGHIRHRNLLPLAAHVPRPDCHYLVYEYMKNGALYDHLHSDQYSDQDSSLSSVTVSWKIRIDVLLGVSRAIER